VQNDNERKLYLIQSLFNSQDGKELLNLWVDEYQERKVFNQDPILMAYRAGQSDVVWDIKSYLKMTIEDFKDKSTNEDSLFN
jgi:hypothetical protein